MRSAATWLVVGALFAIALLAAVDGLRGASPPARPAGTETQEVRAGGSRERVSAPPPIEDVSAVRAELEVAGITGTLYLTDPGCRLWTLELPSLAWRAQVSGPAPDCRFALSPRGEGALFGRAVWNPTGDLGAVDKTTGESGPRIELSSEATGWTFGFEGTHPAFRPDGALTFALEGELWGWVEGPCPSGARTVVFRSLEAVERCLRMLLARDDLEREFRSGVAALRDPSLGEAVWLDRRTSAVLVHGRSGRETVIAVLEDGKVRVRFAAFGPVVSDLEASPRGTRLAARFGEGVLVFDRSLQIRGDGGGAGDVREIAWPADQRFTLVATEANVYVIRAGDPMIQIPVAVSNLAWHD